MALLRFDIAYHVSKYLDTRDWLALRLTCVAWAEFMESLCTDHKIMTALGRQLGGNVLDIRIMDFRYQKRTAQFFKFVVREQMARMSEPEKVPFFRKLYNKMAIEWLPPDSEDANYMLDYDSLYKKYRLPMFWHEKNKIKYARLASRKALEEIAREEITFARTAFHLGLEVWDVYTKTSCPSLRCPKSLVYLPHGDFVRKFLRVVKNCRLDTYGRLCTSCRIIYIEETPDPLDGDYILNCFSHDDPQTDVIDILVPRLKSLKVRKWPSCPRSYEKWLTAVYERKPDLIDTKRNRKVLGMRFEELFACRAKSEEASQHNILDNVEPD